jgi:hypothetical protein
MIFLSHFKGPSSQDQQKASRRRLITSKVTLTGQSHFMLIFVLRIAKSIQQEKKKLRNVTYRKSFNNFACFIFME